MSAKPSQGIIAFNDGGLQIGDEPLVDREVGNAGEADLAVAPRLRRGPFDGVVEIDRLGERPRLALAGRLAGAAAVDAHGGVALRHPPFGRDGLPVHVGRGFFLETSRRHPELVLLVRPEIEDRREFAAVVRPEHVGLEFRAIAHRHVDVFFDLELVGGGGGFDFEVHCVLSRYAASLRPHPEELASSRRSRVYPTCVRTCRSRVNPRSAPPRPSRRVLASSSG